MKKSIFYLMMWSMLLIIAPGCSFEDGLTRGAIPEETTPETPVTGTITTLAITTNPIHNGLMQGWQAFGTGVWTKTTSFGTSNQEPETESITIPSRMELSASLRFDTIDVEEFGAEVVTYPDFTETEISTDTLVGKKIVMSTIRLSDGQLVDGEILWGYTPNPDHREVHPHVEGRNPFFGEIQVTPIPGTSPALAIVTTTFTGEVIGKDADQVTGDTGEKSVTHTYIQRKKEKPEPEPEEKPEPETYSCWVSVSMEADRLKAKAGYSNASTSKEKSWSSLTWGEYKGTEEFYVETPDTIRTNRYTNVSFGVKEKPTTDSILWKTEVFYNVIDSVCFLSTAKGEIPREMKAVNTATNAELHLPDGRKVTVEFIVETVFDEITYKVVPELVGRTSVQSGDTYVYTSTLVQSSRNYVTCHVIWPDGTETYALVDGGDVTWPAGGEKSPEKTLFVTYSAEHNLYVKETK